MLYVPTGRVSAYAPEAFVDVVREDVPVTATVAPTTGLPPEVTVPESVPVGPRGAAVTAARASMRPSPQTLLSSAVPPQVRSDTSSAVSSRICRVCVMSPMSDGAADSISATTPATCGAAMDVPLSEAYVLPGYADRTLTPGALMFGLISPPTAPPRDENEAMTLL